MALIKCAECNREISDKAQTCPGCGAPVASQTEQTRAVPLTVPYNATTDTFRGTMVLLVKLAMSAVQSFGWKLNQANENLGLVTFETGMSFGSWSGVSGSLNIEEIGPNSFKITGTGKQNVRGGQLGAGTATGGYATGDTLVGIEDIIGSAYADEIFGDSDSNMLIGANGADTLFGANGDDIIHGGEGNDSLSMGEGRDFVYGGEGADTFVMSHDGEGYSEFSDIVF